jgi:hypothetical protein
MVVLSISKTLDSFSITQSFFYCTGDTLEAIQITLSQDTTS